MKAFIQGFLVLIVIVLLYLFVTSIEPINNEQLLLEKERLEIQQKQLELESQQNYIQNQIKRREAFTSAFLLIIPSVVIGGVFFIFVTGGYFLIHTAHKRIENSQRAIDGLFALKQLEVNGVKVLVDPNKLAGSIGALTQDTILKSKPNLSNESLQLKLLETQEKGKTLRFLPEIKYTAHAKLLAGSYEKPLKQLEKEIDVYETPQPLLSASSSIDHLNTAIEKSDSQTWYIGQDVESGDLQGIDLGDIVHTGIVGATKTGKTSNAAVLMMYYALKNGYHVIAFDGKGGIDWQEYENYIEVFSVDYTNISKYVDRLCEIHGERLQRLQALGKSSFDQISGYKPKKILVFFEEFGYIMQSLKASDKKLYQATESKLSNLMRVSRCTDIYMCLIDQNPTKWPNTIKANVKLFIAFKLKGKLGTAIDEYHLDQLAPKGQCFIEGKKTNTWLVKPELPKLLTSVPTIKKRII